MNIYLVNEFKEKEYDWSKAGRKKAKRYRYECIAIRITVILLAFFEAFLVLYYKFLKSSGFIWWALALIILLYGLLLTCASSKRKSVEHMSIEDKHDYNLYLYHHVYWKNRNTANKILLNNAMLLVQLKRYRQAAQALDSIYIEKCSGKEMKQMYFLRLMIAAYEDEKDDIEQEFTRYIGIKDEEKEYPDDELLKSYIQMKDLEDLAECLEKIKSEKKKEYPVLISIITLLGAYSVEFLGLLYGINRDVGYEIRANYLRSSFVIVETVLVILMIAGIIWVCRRLDVKERKAWKKKVRKVISSVCLGIIAVCVLFSNFMAVIEELDNRETIIKEENGMIYLEVTKSSGYDSYAEQYKTNNPFIMKKIYLPGEDDASVDHTKDNQIQDNNVQNSMEQENMDQGSTGQSQSTWDEEAHGTRIQDGMSAVYRYLSETNALQNLEFTYSSNAKGEVYAIVSSGQEEKDGKSVKIEYRIYYNNEKTDENGVVCDEYVLEKKYIDGEYDKQLVGFYLVNPDTKEVADEHKTTW